MEQFINILPFILMLLVFWFLIIRPSQKRAKETQNMQNSLKRGDKVVTIGGMHGEIDSLEDSLVHIKVKDGTILTFERQAIGRVISE